MTPGSDKATAHGCTCPVLDNGHGQGRPGHDGHPLYWIAYDCPLHGPNAKETDDEG